MSTEAVALAINTAASAIDRVISIKETLAPGSIIEVSATSRVAAPCIWERDLYFSDSKKTLADCIRVAENLYTGFYLMALNSIMPVGKIDVQRTLGSIAPDRSKEFKGLQKVIMQSYKEPSRELVFLDDSDTKVTYDDKLIDNLNKEANALTGKYLMLTLTDGEASMKLPLNISLTTANTTPEVLTNILGAAGNQNTYGARYHRMMAGELKFWKDLVFSSDLVSEYKRNTRLDKEGLQRAINAARLRAAKAAVATNVKSSGAIAVTYIISKSTARAIERKAAGNLNNFAFRQKLMVESLCMQLFVIDADEEMVEVYFHSIERSTVIPFKQLEKSNANATSGGDLLAVLQSLKTGNIPQIR